MYRLPGISSSGLFHACFPLPLLLVDFHINYSLYTPIPDLYPSTPSHSPTLSLFLSEREGAPGYQPTLVHQVTTGLDTSTPTEADKTAQLGEHESTDRNQSQVQSLL